jgi:hypothetical protein
MRAGKLDTDFGLLGERLDRLLALTQQLDELQAFGARHGLSDAGDLLAEVVLQSSHENLLTTIRV